MLSKLYVSPDLVVKSVLRVTVYIDSGLELNMSLLDFFGTTTLLPLQSNTLPSTEFVLLYKGYSSKEKAKESLHTSAEKNQAF